MRVIQTCILALLIALSGTALAEDVSALAAGCDDCHGSQGVSPHSDVPTIAGQSAGYLEKTLSAYQRWDRPCIKSRYRGGDTSRPRTDMCQIAEGMSSADIEALAAHYSALPFKAAQQDFDPALADAGSALHETHCESCHAQGGSVAGRAPRIAGQWSPYLRVSLKYVPTGEHLVPPKMEKGIAGLSAEELDSLMNFYASQQD